VAHELDQILISWFQPGAGDKLQKLCWEVRREAAFINDADRRSQVRQICHDVWGGDKAVAEYTKKFDGVKLTPEQFRVSKRDLEGAHKEIKENNPKLFESICQAIKNVREYQEEIFIGNKEENQHLGIKYTPIRRIGICVPGASAPLPSSLIMCAVPAQVAGVKEIAVVSPPRHKGSIHPIILAVCYELGIEEVYRIGGAQAVAAMAFGNGSIPKVDKIVGPGNQWVQTAKLELFGHIGIDSIAGPSEVLIIANAQANAAWVAADMLSQAEHAPGSAVVLTDSQQFAAKVLEELKKQVEKLDRSADTKQCLLKYGGIVVFDDMAKIVKWANEFAAEHLEIQCGKQSKKIADRIENAGAIFIGDYSPVAVGDYWAGPSHTLPTGGSARFFSALSANDFIKSTSIIEYDRQMLAKGAEDIIRLAEAEGLDAHARSIRIRQQSEKA
jgi:histidinol dehydrogenase